MNDLVRCPLCGEDKGYTLGTGDTYRWWTVCCGACGRQVDECRSDGNTSMNAAKPLSWPAADEVWNAAGALAVALRRQCAGMVQDCARAGDAIVECDIEIESLRAQVQAQALQILALTGEVATAIAAEREACAAMCEAGIDPSPADGWARAHNNACRTRAAAIRERSSLGQLNKVK